MTDVLGILGWPVGHSRSPAMHNAAIAALGLDATYVPFAVAPPDLPAAITGLRALGVLGVNLTLPHKEAALPLLDEVEPAAAAIGAVNTIVRVDDRLVGANTDAPGFARALEEHGVDVNATRVLVVGAGGAARAAVVGLSQRGAASIAIAARRIEQARALVAGVQAVCSGTQLSAVPLEQAQLTPVAAASTLLVQATSATLAGRPLAEQQRFAQALPIEALPKGAVVTDIVYDPLTTAVLERAQACGLKTVDGLGMLLHQGAIALERWTGHQPPLDVMRHALGA